VDAAESAVGHDEDVVAGAAVGGHRRDEVFQVVHATRTGAERGKASFMTPRFIVFERGSKTARMRPCPAICRKPSIVVRMAVGWWAKSS